MKLYYIINCYLFITGVLYKNIITINLLGLSVISYSFNLMNNIKNIEIPKNIYNPFKKLHRNFIKNQEKNNLKKFSLLSKLIYEYDYVNNINKKDNYIIDNTSNIESNFTTNFIQNTNIYFNFMQYITFLDKKDFFVKDSDKYLDFLDKKFPETQIYGYFYNKKRLHALILLNHKYEEIIVVFRGSQYTEEWMNNLLLYEKNIEVDKKYSIHKGIYDMYRDHDNDKNILYILKNLYHYFPNYKKIITGHSKGSINSLLLAHELLNYFGEKYNYEIYTFGCPPIFNYEFGLFLHSHNQLKIHNIMNNYDIITSFMIPYRYHVGMEIRLNGKNITYVDHEEPYRTVLFETLIFFYKAIINHDMNKYIENIFI
jgi:hypothetical protein